jgi:transcriptional regulator with XRE-family HTH domain
MHKIRGGDIVFYDKYAQICNQRGVSVSAAAEAAGVSKSLVTKWKKHKVEIPSPDVLKKLSAYFGIPVSELLGEEEQKEKPTVQDDGLTEHHIKLIEFAKTLSVEDAKLLLVALQAKRQQ